MSTETRDSIFIKQGIYDPTRRFEFTNISSKPFTFQWNGIPATISPGEKVILRHHLAVLATIKLVDEVMQSEIHDEEEKLKVETKNPYYRSPRAGSIGVPAMREIWEKKILRELPAKADNDAQLQIERQQFIDGLVRDINGEQAPPIAVMSDLKVTAKEFEDINLPKSN